MFSCFSLTSSCYLVWDQPLPLIPCFPNQNMKAREVQDKNIFLEGRHQVRLNNEEPTCATFQTLDSGTCSFQQSSKEFFFFFWHPRCPQKGPRHHCKSGCFYLRTWTSFSEFYLPPPSFPVSCVQASTVYLCQLHSLSLLHSLPGCSSLIKITQM